MNASKRKSKKERRSASIARSKVASPTLLIIEATGEKRRFKIAKKRVTIGRKGCDIRFNDPKISGKHAMIDKDADAYVLIDLDSTNGTFVNGSKIKRKKLMDQDVIQIGFTQICFFTNPTLSLTPNTQIADNLSSEVKTALQKTPTISITIEVEGSETHTFFERNVFIGSGLSHLTLDDDDISDRHALIQRIGLDRMYITDLNTATGTFLNDQQINSARLNRGDRIRVGKQELKIGIVEK